MVVSRVAKESRTCYHDFELFIYTPQTLIEHSHNTNSIYVIVWSTVVFGINSASNAGMKIVIV